MTDGPADSIILGTVDRGGLDRRIMWGRESPATLTCLALATFYDMNENDETEYDDDYSKEQHLDLKALEGWTRCEGCGDRIHLNDVREGASCSCEDE